MKPPRSLALSQPLHVFWFTWLGQLISVVGSGLTSFLIGLHIYQDTGSITQLSLVSFFYSFPAVVLSPMAGALVDRWDRRRAMLISDLGAGLGAVLIWVLLVAGRAQVWPIRPWHFFFPIAQISVFGALRGPAYLATISLLVPKRQLGRANGMIQLAAAAGQVVAPMLAVVLVARIGLERVILTDVGTFAFAILCLLILRFPSAPAAAGELRGGSLWHEIRYAWSFIQARFGLVGLLVLMSALFVVMGLVWVLVTPLVLSVADTAALSVTFSIAGGGMLLGGVVMSAWGGPRRRMRGVLGFLLCAGVVLFMGALPPSAPLVAIGCASFLFCIPLIGGSTNAIWQSKVPPGVQGRVFAVRQTLILLVSSLASLIAGPLADRWFEPWLARGGALSGSVGRVIGTGPGRGIGFLFVLLGILLVAVVIAAYLTPRLRDLEDLLPDAFPEPAPQSTVAGAPPAAEAPGPV
jgi:DHA3 family macrolide efflux protein-like MFS transporter